MSVWAILALWLAGTWFVGAVFAAGLLWEREHILQNPEMRQPWWWASYLFTAACWLVLWPLWGDSRPVLPQPPEPEEGYLGADSRFVYTPPEEVGSADWSIGPGLVFVPEPGPPRMVRTDLLYRGPEGSAGYGIVDTFDSLATPAPEGSICVVADEPGRLYGFVNGEWRVKIERDCPRCDTDNHTCHGCGTSLWHYAATCAECAREGS